MFTIPATGSGILLVARPSASSGTITNATNAYDLPSGRPDDPPYTTKASRATVTGSAVAGTVDYDVVEYNTFPSRSKSNFSKCQIVIGVLPLLTATVVTSTLNPKSGLWDNVYVNPDLSIDYQIDGTNWVNITRFETSTIQTGGMGPASNAFSVSESTGKTPGATTTDFTGSTVTVNKEILASAFPSNLNSLKIRFRMGTCTNNGASAYKSSGSYDIWDIRANIS